jgi:hypothetical protein
VRALEFGLGRELGDQDEGEVLCLSELVRQLLADTCCLIGLSPLIVELSHLVDVFGSCQRVSCVSTAGE